ncbi:MAG: hypothetical protein HFI75_05730 [Lachnospiraceae bacterium]|nr:hypothetical protein [Lachnospiraceae bacterium]
MINQLELPVNKKHFMRSSTTRAGLYSIMTSEDYAGAVNAKFSDVSIAFDNDKVNYFFQREEFNSRLENCNLNHEEVNKTISCLSSPYVEDKYAYIYKTLKYESDKSCIWIKVDYLQDSNALSNIKIVFSNGIIGFDDTYHEAIFNNECYLKLSVRGLLVFSLDSFHKSERIFEPGEKKQMYLKLEYRKAKGSVMAQYSFNGEDFNTIGEVTVGNIMFSEVGVYVAPKVNPFFYDFYTSHIQLCIDPTLKRLTPFPDMEDQYFSNMLDVYQVPREIINFDNSAIDTFILLLSMGYYIRLRLDEFYIQGGFHLDHANFLYGYNIEQKKFLMIGYHKFLEFFELDFEKFLYAATGKRGITDKITLYKYNSKYYPNKFNLDILLFNLQAYVTGKSEFVLNSKKAVIYDKKLPMICGVKIYDEIIKTEEYMICFVEDIRMSHQLQEHNVIMIDLLNFLKSIKILTEECYIRNVKRFHENLKLSEIMKNMVLKNEIKAVDGIYEKLQTSLRKLGEKDMEAMQLLIRDLEKIKVCME